MQVRMMTEANRTRQDVSEPIRCAPVNKPTEAQKHKKELLRYVVVVIALLAVLFLIAIALYYTQGNSVTIRHVRLVLPQVPLALLS